MTKRKQFWTADGAAASSTSVEWATPQAFFDALDARWHFTLDACATAENAKCARFFSPEEDGLAQDWGGQVVFCNPPYGRGETGRWLRKAWLASYRGATVVLLIPARTDTAWWHDYAAFGEVTFVRGRLKFNDGKDSAPFPSAIVVFRAVQISSERTAA